MFSQSNKKSKRYTRINLDDFLDKHDSDRKYIELCFDGVARHNCVKNKEINDDEPIECYVHMAMFESFFE